MHNIPIPVEYIEMDNSLGNKNLYIAIVLVSY